MLTILLIVGAIALAVAIAFRRLREIDNRIRDLDVRVGKILSAANSVGSELQRIEERLAKLEEGRTPDESEPATTPTESPEEVEHAAYVRAEVRPSRLI